MMSSPKMVRWIEVEGTRVAFGNVVGPYCGKPYRYRCSTEEMARQFAEYCGQVDEEGCPLAVGADVEARYGAVREETRRSCDGKDLP